MWKMPIGSSRLFVSFTRTERDYSMRKEVAEEVNDPYSGLPPDCPNLNDEGKCAKRIPSEKWNGSCPHCRINRLRCIGNPNRKYGKMEGV